MLRSISTVTLFACLAAISSHAAAQNQYFKPSLTERTPALDVEALGRKLSSLHGVARPKQEAQLMSSVEGVVRDIRVVENQLVKAGQPLVVLDDRVAQAKLLVAKTVANSRGKVNEARATLKITEYNLKQVQQAYRQGAATESEWLQASSRRDQARAALEAQEDAVNEAEGNLALSEKELEMQTIAAPFDGRVVRIHCKLGTEASRQAVLVTVATLDRLQVELNLPLNLYGQLSESKLYTLEAGAPLTRPIEAELVVINPVLDSATRTLRCVFEIDNADEKLPAGFLVNFNPPALEVSQASQSK